MTTLQALAFWALSVWDPTKMDFLHGPRRARLRLYYRTKGIVMHDRREPAPDFDDTPDTEAAPCPSS